MHGPITMTRDNPQPNYAQSQPPEILVADDDPRLLNALASLLRQQGYRVTEAPGDRGPDRAVRSPRPVI